jgi:hypothetical protein
MSLPCANDAMGALRKIVDSATNRESFFMVNSSGMDMERRCYGRSRATPLTGGHESHR